MSDQNFASAIETLIGGTADTFVVCAGAGQVVAQKTASEVRTLLGVVTTSTTITAGTGLSGGGDLSANRTLSLANTAVTAGSYTSANITVDAQGRITAAANGSSATPGGSSGQVQFNNAGSFGGAAAVVYSATGNHFVVTAQSATAIPLCAKGAASQTGNLTEWQNSAGTNLLRVSSSGALQFGTQPDSISATGGEISIRSDNGVGNNATYTFGATGGLVLPGAVVMGGSVNVLMRSGADVFVQNNTGSVHLRPNSSQSSLQADLNTTAGQTRILLWDVDKGSLQRVSIGAADSGGTGFKVLRVPN